MALIIAYWIVIALSILGGFNILRAFAAARDGVGLVGSLILQGFGLVVMVLVALRLGA